MPPCVGLLSASDARAAFDPLRTFTPAAKVGLSRERHLAEKLFENDRLDVYYDGSAICVVAVGSHGDPLDLGEGEVEDLIARLQAALAESKA